MERNTVFRGKTVNDVWEKAYIALARQAAAGKSQGSRDGSVVGEILNATFMVEDPTRMIVTSDIRKLPMRYAVGELIWYLSGSNKTSDIAQFSKVWNKLSDDGVHSNSSYGYRIHEKFGLDQWEAVKEMLIMDPLSRQAIIHIKAPEDNVTVTPTKDLPCTLSLQFFIREGRLHMTVHMRSNDIWTGTPYDMFSFCCMQVKMAMELGVEVGSYTHTAGSLHLYERNYKEVYTDYTYDEMAEQIISELAHKMNTDRVHLFDKYGERLSMTNVLEQLRDYYQGIEHKDSDNEYDVHSKPFKPDDNDMSEYNGIPSASVEEKSNALSEAGVRLSWDELQCSLGMVVAVDFDGCLCKDKYPLIGAPNIRVINRLIQIRKNGGRVILNTCRNGELLDRAVEFCKMYNLEFDAVNKNLPEVIKYFGYDTRKIWAKEYWDDKAVNMSYDDRK